MSNEKIFEFLAQLVDNSVKISGDKVEVTDPEGLKANIHKLVEISALGSDLKALLARYLVRAAALELGVIPASIHDLYTARGAGKIPNDFTVPAVNLRILSFDAARMVFRVAVQQDAGAFIFEIARSEIGYTDQRPTEFTASILGAAIAEGYRGPVFIQGDHFQVSVGRYKEDAGKELQTIKDLTVEAVQAGFYNIDVDTSTLVDLDKPTVPEQQVLNTTLSAEMTHFIRKTEPEGVTISVGGEIGEVGGHNSNPEELRAYAGGFNEELAKLGESLVGLSKISIQTGTSHGGVVLPDGSIASVNVDFDTLKELGQITRDEYGMGGAVQHGASTLPQDAFGKFVEAEALEVHLATNFQNIFYDQAPAGFMEKVHAYLDENHQNERKSNMTDDQFYYKTRKRAVGPFKKETWALPQDVKDKVLADWEKQFSQLFTLLAVGDTKKYVDEFVTAVKVQPDLDHFTTLASATQEAEDTSDLAD